jgi:hypothetical protein
MCRCAINNGLSNKTDHQAQGWLGVEGKEENEIIKGFKRNSRKRMLIKQAEGSGGGSLDDGQDVRRCASGNVLWMSVVLRLVQSRACRREGWMMCFWKWRDQEKKICRKNTYMEAWWDRKNPALFRKA